MAPRPVVTATTEELYSALGPWAQADTDGAVWPLLQVAESIAARLQPIEDVIRDSDSGPGWSQVMDADRAPSAWLGWAAQFAGVRLLQGLSDAAQRARIKATDGFNRGSTGALVAAAQQSLTGTKTVYLTERHGSAYRFTVATLVSETPDSARLLRDLLEQKPGGDVMVVSALVGGDYLTLRDTHSDYADVKATYATYLAVRTNPAQQ